MKLLLKCKDVTETKSFYQDTLGFQVSDSAEGSCTVELAGGAIIFSSADNLGDEPRMSGSVYFYPSDVDSYFETVKDKAEVVWPLQDMPRGNSVFVM